MRALLLLFLFSCTIAAVCEANGAWLTKVPEKDRVKTNPYQSQPDAVAAGALVYEDHCSHCHGKQAEGNKKHPSLKSERVQQQATEGDLHWLLVNGNMGRGMPSWAKLGDPQIWQVVTYLKSLH